MKLLREIEATGPPRDYLFARIRYRRSALDISGRGRWGAASEPHQALRAEYVWVYGQLERRLRQDLLPFFEYVELRTLVIALRYLAAEEQAAMRAQLKFSLLQPQLQNVLLDAQPVAPLVAVLERLLSSEYRSFAGLSQVYLRQGPGGLEQALLGGFLQQSVTQWHRRPLRELLRYLLDMRNLLALYKHLHWQVPLAPPLLPGGTLELGHCESLWANRDLAALMDMVRKTATQPGDPEAIGVEDFLFQGLSTRLRRAGRDPLQLGLVLDYLWRCQLATRNRGLRLSGAAVTEEEPVAEVAG